MPEKKEPMIGQENRPTAIDYDLPIGDFKLRDLYAVIQAHIRPEKELLKTEKEHFKSEKEKEILKVEKEYVKPEKEKEILKVEKEYVKPEKEKELLKPEKEKEFFKPEKEALKPEKELSKPEKVFDPGLVEQIATAVIEKLKAQGIK
jgi:hypothetical protein